MTTKFTAGNFSAGKELIMKKALLFAATAAVALLTACSSGALYKNVKTEETFRRIKDTNPQDLGIKTVSYDYKITGGTKIDAMSINMMEGDRLRISYSKNKKTVFTCIMNKEKFCRINADKKVEALDAAGQGTLKFFYDINFKDPAKAAKYITLTNEKPVVEGKKSYYVFDLAPKKVYGLDKVTLKVNAKTGFIEAVDFQYPENEQELIVKNAYNNITVKSGLTVAQTIESSFLGKKFTYKLTDFAINRSVKADDFNVPEIKVQDVKAEKKVDKKADKKTVKDVSKKTK